MNFSIGYDKYTCSYSDKDDIVLMHNIRLVGLRGKIESKFNVIGDMTTIRKTIIDIISQIRTM
jgi:hypothetical protein